MDLLDSSDHVNLTSFVGFTANVHIQINGIQFILHVFLGSETRYLRRGVQHTGLDFKQEFFTFKRIDTTPLTRWDYVQPLTFITREHMFSSRQ